MRHLDEEHELSRSVVKFMLDHLYDTINVLGGTRGLFFIALGCILFYVYVVYAMRTSREKREARMNKIY